MNCTNCGEAFEGGRCLNCDTANADDPNARADAGWVVVYGGEPKWRLVIGKTLDSAGIVNRTREERAEANPYFRNPPQWMEVSVRQADEARALETLEDLKEKIPEAFPEGTL